MVFANGLKQDLGDGVVTKDCYFEGGAMFLDVDALTDVSAGRTTDGKAWTWGKLSVNLGDGIATNSGRSSPISIVGGHSFVKVVVGGQMLGLKAGGSAWAWGENDFGQVGDGTRFMRSSPVSVIGEHSFTDVALGDGTRAAAALKADGSVWTWGRNDVGQLGVGDKINRSSPVSVIGGHSFVAIDLTDITTGRAVAIKADGSAWGWGGNTLGGIGDGTVNQRSSPVSVVGGHSFVEIACIPDTTYARKSDGSAWAWGQNGAGQCGDGTTISRSSPVSVIGGHSFITVGRGIALKSDGSAWAWGSGFFGGIGDGTTSNRSSPVSVVGGHSFVQISTGETGGIDLNRYGRKADGSVWGWGSSSGTGAVGDGTSQNRSSPVSVIGAHTFALMDGGSARAVAMKSDGSAWAWGLDPLGNGTADRYSPTQVVGGHSFVLVRAGAALKDDGTAWAWGQNSRGRVGDNTTVDRNSPVSVIGTHSFTSLAVDIKVMALLKADGSLWTCGDSGGVLGDGTTAGRSSPVSVIGGHSFVSIAVAGNNVMLALKANGSAWGWGFNSFGNVGDGTINQRSSPVSVIGGHSFVAVSVNNNALAMKADGSVWAWGRGTAGALGDGSTQDRSSPVSVIGGHSFVAVVSGARSFAMKTDGSVWAWGNGPLGDGTFSNRSSPVSVVGPFSFVQDAPPSAGNHVIFRTASGGLAGWGENSNGQVGDGTAQSDRSSPVSVANTPAARSIKDVTAGDKFIWNGDRAGFDLDATDSIDFEYI